MASARERGAPYTKPAAASKRKAKVDPDRKLPLVARNSYDFPVDFVRCQNARGQAKDYLVHWLCRDPATHKRYPDEWIPAENVTKEVADDWKRWKRSNPGRHVRPVHPRKKSTKKSQPQQNLVSQQSSSTQQTSSAQQPAIQPISGRTRKRTHGDPTGPDPSDSEDQTSQLPSKKQKLKATAEAGDATFASPAPSAIASESSQQEVDHQQASPELANSEHSGSVYIDQASTPVNPPEVLVQVGASNHVSAPTVDNHASGTSVNGEEGQKSQLSQSSDQARFSSGKVIPDSQSLPDFTSSHSVLGTTAGQQNQPVIETAKATGGPESVAPSAEATAEEATAEEATAEEATAEEATQSRYSVTQSPLVQRSSSPNIDTESLQNSLVGVPETANSTSAAKEPQQTQPTMASEQQSSSLNTSSVPAPPSQIHSTNDETLPPRPQTPDETVTTSTKGGSSANVPVQNSDASEQVQRQVQEGDMTQNAESSPVRASAATPSLENGPLTSQALVAKSSSQIAAESIIQDQESANEAPDEDPQDQESADEADDEDPQDQESADEADDEDPPSLSQSEQPLLNDPLHDQDVQAILPLPLYEASRKHYLNHYKYERNFLQSFVDEDPQDLSQEQIERAEAFHQHSCDFTLHQDLIGEEPFTQVSQGGSFTVQLLAKQARDVSSKFRFLATLINTMNSFNEERTVLLLAKPGLPMKYVSDFLEGTNVSVYCRALEVSVQGDGPVEVVLLSAEDLPQYSQAEFDIIIGLDETFDAFDPRVQQIREKAQKENSFLPPAIGLCVPLSTEHFTRECDIDDTGAKLQTILLHACLQRERAGQDLQGVPLPETLAKRIADAIHDPSLPLDLPRLSQIPLPSPDSSQSEQLCDPKESSRPSKRAKRSAAELETDIQPRRSKRARGDLSFLYMTQDELELEETRVTDSAHNPSSSARHHESSAHSQRREMRRHIKELEQQLKTMKQENATLHRTTDSYMAQHHTLFKENQKLKDVADRVPKLEARVADLVKTKDSAKEDARTANREIAKLESILKGSTTPDVAELARLREQANLMPALEQRLATKDAELEYARDTFRAEATKAAANGAELAEAQAELESLRPRLERAEKQERVALKRESKDNWMAKSSQEMKKVKQQLDAAGQQLENAWSRAEALQRENDDLKSRAGMGLATRRAGSQQPAGSRAGSAQPLSSGWDLSPYPGRSAAGFLSATGYGEGRAGAAGYGSSRPGSRAASPAPKPARNGKSRLGQ